MKNTIARKTIMGVLLPGLILCSIAACKMDGAEKGSTPMGTQKSLTGTAWWVEDIAGRGVIDSSHTTLEFTGDGRVGGDTGCNRYFGSVEIDGQDISFSPLAGTRKACHEPLMDQEMKFYQAVGKVVSWEIAETGLLHLRDGDKNDQLRAWRITE